MTLVLIEWVDSSSDSSKDWLLLSQISEWAEVLHIKSVGWLLDDNDDFVTIAPHIYDIKQNPDITARGTGHMTIPTSAIIKMTVLRR